MTKTVTTKSGRRIALRESADANKGKWYDKYKVPATAKNKSLGLEGIALYSPSKAQAAHGMVCTAVIKLLSGSIRLVVKESQKREGELYLNIPGTDKYADENGEVKYYDNVNLKVELKAQILKYVETQLEE